MSLKLVPASCTSFLRFFPKNPRKNTIIALKILTANSVVLVARIMEWFCIIHNLFRYFFKQKLDIAQIFINSLYDAQIFSN